MGNFFEFHCHTHYSQDGVAKIDDIIASCRLSNIRGIAITDHNEIKGALEMKKKAPGWLKVIVGEEIETDRGEIIGLFLKKKIDMGQRIEKTMSEIKKQGGLVIIPHPFDRLRSKKVPHAMIIKNIRYIDAIETFNARNIFQIDNEKAKKFAEDKNIPQICGSDAHFIREYGKTFMTNIDCQDASHFLESLNNTNFIVQKASLIFHLLTKYQKLIHIK